MRERSRSPRKGCFAAVSGSWCFPHLRRSLPSGEKRFDQRLERLGPGCFYPYNKTPIAIVALITNHIVYEMVMSASRCTMP
jgi:hypothetical protein